MQDDLAQQHAQFAIRQKALHETVWFLQDEAGIASGTLLARGLRTFVLTVRHFVVELPPDHSSVVVGRVGHEGARGRMTRSWVHPSLDLALVELAADFVPAESIATCIDDLAPFPEEFESGDGVVLVGFPAELARRARQIVVVHHAENASEVRHLEDGRIFIPWNEATQFVLPSQVDAAAIESILEQTEQGLKPLADPRGMSGGGWWHLRSEATFTGVWNAAPHLRLIGVQTAMLEGSGREVIAVPLDANVIDWLRETTR